MSVFSAHELLQVVPCKIAGCEQERHWRTGRLAGLCLEHGKLAANSPEFRADRERALELRRDAGARLRSVTVLRKQVEGVVAAEKRVRHAQRRTTSTLAGHEARLAHRRRLMVRAYLECGVALGIVSGRRAA